MKNKSCLLTLILLLFAVNTYQAQTEKVPSSSPQSETKQTESDCFTEHKTALDFYDNLRLRPITVTSIEGATVFYNYKEKYLIRPESVVLTSASELPEGFKTKHEDRNFFLVYCQQHFTVQIIQRIEKQAKISRPKS